MGWFSRGPDIGKHYTPHKPWALVEYKSGGGLPKRVEFYETQAHAAHELRKNIVQESDEFRHAYIIHHLSGPSDLRRVFHTEMTRGQYAHLALLQYRAANARRGPGSLRQLVRMAEAHYGSRARKSTHADWRGYKVVHMTDIRLHNNAGIRMPVCKAGAKMLDMDATGLKQTSDFSKVTCAKCRARHPKRYPWAVRHGREALVEEARKARHAPRSRYGSAELETGKFYAYKGHRVWLDAVPGGYFAMVEGTALQARGSTQGEALKRLREKLDAGAANYRRRKARRR